MNEESNTALGAERLVARVERAYLAALRIALLLLATGLVVYALWLGITGAWHWSRDAKHVTAAPVEITAKEVADIPAEAPTIGNTTVDPLRAEKAFYRTLANQYFGVYQKGYERFQQPKDQHLTAAAFEERFLGSDRRVQAIADGEINFGDDKQRLERLAATMSDVAALPGTVARLQRYRKATRTTVSRVVSGTRPERYCSYYGYYINECITYATRQVAFKRTVTEAKLPKGVVEPPVLFGQQQDRFLTLLANRKDDHAAAANAERERIIAGNALGGSRLWTALGVALGFLVLMFLFLLIAIERHQRELVATLPPR